MAKVGRPTEYKPEYCERVIEFMRSGAALVEVADDLDICVDTLAEWRKKHPEFAEAIKKGIKKSEAWWVRNGRVNLENKDFSATLWYMNMKNRFGWADKKEVTQTTEVTISEETKRKVRNVID